MIKNIEEKTSGIEIDLRGPDGNAFSLLAIAANVAKQLDWSRERIDRLRRDMMSGDYENLVAVMDKRLGDYITMYRES